MSALQASVERIACADLPALPLQLAQRGHPEWRGHAVVVIDEDSPRGHVLWANERARKAGILPGLRYAAGLSLDANLRATVVPEEEIALALRAITTTLQTLSPTVEPSPVGDDPGVFWLDATGLTLLYPSLEVWAEAVRAAIAGLGLTCALTVGFSRFGSYATARALAGRGHRVWVSAVDEAHAARRVPLHRVGLDPKAREVLAQLGVHTLGQLAQLPEAGLRRRFGKEVHRLHQRAAGTREEPLTPAAPHEPACAALDFDDEVGDHEALVFFVKQLLDPLLQRLAGRGEALAALTLTLVTTPPREEQLAPAVPTLDGLQLLNLVRLRLEHATLAGGVRALRLEVSGQRATREQLALFFDGKAPKRDRAAADRALARLRAILGDDAVVRARLGTGHLPEAGFVWEPLTHVPAPQPRATLMRPLVRRVRARPQALPARPAREPDGWMPLGLPHGPVKKLTGPFKLSGGWWNTEVRRDYYYAQLEAGDIQWIYYDQPRRKWYLHGAVA